MNEHQKLKLDELLEDYKDAVLKAYSWREYSGVYYLHKSQLEHAAKQAIFDYFEKVNNDYCKNANERTPDKMWSV